MGNNWKYHLGQWTEIDDLLKWADHPSEDFDAILERAGFNKHALWSYGDEAPLFAECYEKEGGGPPWFISFTLTDNCIGQVCFDDPLSLLQWTRDYLPIFMLTQISSAQEDTAEKLKKL